MSWCLCEPAVVDWSAVCGQHYKANAFLVQVPKHSVHDGLSVFRLPAGALKCNESVRRTRPKSGAMKQSVFYPSGQLTKNALDARSPSFGGWQLFCGRHWLCVWARWHGLAWVFVGDLWKANVCHMQWHRLVTLARWSLLAMELKLNYAKFPATMHIGSENKSNHSS